MGILAVELAKNALEWLLAHWKVLGWPLAILFFLLWHSSASHLTFCEARLSIEENKPVPVVETESQGKSNVTVSAHVTWPKPASGKIAPCPDVTVDASTLASADSTWKQNLPMCPTPEKPPYWGVELSTGVPIYALADTSVGGSVIAGPWRAGVEYSFQNGPRLALGHRWMFR